MSATKSVWMFRSSPASRLLHIASMIIGTVMSTVNEPVTMTKMSMRVINAPLPDAATGGSYLGAVDQTPCE